MVERDASFYPLYTHTPLLGLIFHCVQLEVSLIYGMFPCTTDHYRCCDELPGIYLASIDFLIRGSKLLLKSVCCTSFLFFKTPQCYWVLPYPSFQTYLKIQNHIFNHIFNVCKFAVETQD